MDIIEFIFITVATAVGIVSLVIELLRHVPFGKALLLAVGNGFIAFVVVAFGSALLAWAATAIKNKGARGKGPPEET